MTSEASVLVEPKVAPDSRGLSTIVWRPFLRLLSGSNFLAWVDQGVVSASSFLALVMIGRWSAPSELGAYAIGLSMVAILLATQDSLITRPYTISLHRDPESGPRQAFNALALSLLLSVVAALVAAGVAVVIAWVDSEQKLSDVLWMLAWTMPFLMLREFARRLAFANLRVMRALLIDIAVAVIAAAGLGVLEWFGHLSAVTALAVTGFACAVVTAGWLVFARREFERSGYELLAGIKRSWRLGKWFLSGQLSVQAQGYMTSWLAMIIAGAAMTGIYTACASVVAIANPLFYGFCNLLTPKSARVLASEGAQGLKRQAIKDALLIGSVMGAFAVAVGLGGDSLMRLLYGGADYVGHGDILIILAIAAVIGAIGVPASTAMAAADCARAMAFLMAAIAVLHVGLAWWLIDAWGLLGAAVGVLIAEAIGSVVRWGAFLFYVPRLEKLSSSIVSPARDAASSALREKLTRKGAVFGAGQRERKATQASDPFPVNAESAHAD